MLDIFVHARVLFLKFINRVYKYKISMNARFHERNQAKTLWWNGVVNDTIKHEFDLSCRMLMEHLLWINVNPTWMSICMQDYAHPLHFCKICWVMPTCSTVSSRKRPLERNVPTGMPCLKQDFRLQVTSSIHFDIGQYSENHVWNRGGGKVWKWLSTVHAIRIVSFVQFQILNALYFIAEKF